MAPPKRTDVAPPSPYRSWIEDRLLGRSTPPPATVVPEFNFQDRLVKARRTAGVSTEDMAQEYNVHRNTITNWERGSTRPEPAQVLYWAELCGVSLEWLLDGQPVEALVTPRYPVAEDGCIDLRSSSDWPWCPRQEGAVSKEERAA